MVDKIFIFFCISRSGTYVNHKHSAINTIKENVAAFPLLHFINMPENVTPGTVLSVTF